MYLFPEDNINNFRTMRYVQNPSLDNNLIKLQENIEVSRSAPRLNLGHKESQARMLGFHPKS